MHDISQISYKYLYESRLHSYKYVKFSKFQNEFMKLSSLPKYEPNFVRISATKQGKNPYHFWFIFLRNNYIINSFWNLLAFTQKQRRRNEWNLGGGETVIQAHLIEQVYRFYVQFRTAFTKNMNTYIYLPT